MSDEPFLLPMPPLMSAVKARNLARSYQALANQLRSEGVTGEAETAERHSNWWMQYAISLAATPPGRIDP